MSQRGIDVVRAHLAKLPRTDSMTVAERRAQYDRAERVFATPADVAVERVTAPVRPAEWLTPPGARPNTVVLYLHGGGYVIGSPRSHRHLAAAIGRAAMASVLLPDYRLAPEHPFPAAVDDAVAAYRWLLARGIAPARIAIAGDSAGGGLTVATLLALRDARVPLPGAGICISPWVDMEASGESMTTKAAEDPMIQRDIIEWFAALYVKKDERRTPLASPIYADLSGLPPLYVLVGTAETLLDDSTRLAERARKAGVQVTLEPWEGMIHVWPAFAPMLDEGREAIERIGAFVRTRTA